MTEKGYQPSLSEIQEAEDTMDERQKELTETREVSLNEGRLQEANKLEAKNNKIIVITEETKNRIEKDLLLAIKEALSTINPKLKLKRGESDFGRYNYLSGGNGNVIITLDQNSTNREIYLEVKINEEYYDLVESLVQKKVSELEALFNVKVKLTVKAMV